MNKTYRNGLVIFSLVSPGLLVFLFATLAPIALSIYFGLTKYSGIGAPEFIGADNFKNIILNDPVFFKSLLNAVLIGLGFILLQHPLSIVFAILLDRIGGRREKFFRTAYFVPCVISVVVTTSMWVNIFNSSYGLLNKVLTAIGLDFLKQEWLGDQNIAIFSIVFICMWQGFGWAMLIYYSGLKGIPEELYEAAKIDGSTGFKMYTRITIPLLGPVIKVNLTLAMISALKQMETVYLATNGGPGNATQTLANYLYIKAFNSYEFGYGNAISVLFVAICVIITVLFNKFIKTDGSAGYEVVERVDKDLAKRKITNISILVIMVIFAIGQLFPLVWLLDYSLNKSGDLFVSGILKWPDPPQFQNYAVAWVKGNVGLYLFNSILVTGSTIILTVIFAMMLSFAFVRMKWKLSGLTMGVMLLGMMIPIHATLLPNFFTFQTIGLTNSYLGLIIPYVAISLPQGIFLMSGFMKSLSVSIEESAVIDGCGIYSIIFRIVFPMMKPAIVTLAIMTFFNCWNEFIMAVTYLSRNELRTLPFSVLNFAGQYASDYSKQFAVMALSTIPAIIFYFVLNEQITKGITMGAVKG